MNKSLAALSSQLAGALRHAAIACVALILAHASIQPAWADYVGEAQTTKYLDKATQDMIAARFQAGQGGLRVGDEISYIIQFTPVPGGTTEMVGGGAYVTDYIPAGTQVVGAQFVQDNGNGTFTQIAPPPPAEVKQPFLPQYSETGIFYSTDPRTAMYTNPANASITAANGYVAPVGGVAPYSIHNAWDSQVATFVGTVNPATNLLCTTPSVATVPSPVAGPDAFIKNDNLGLGPWHRIAYPGSMIATAAGVASPSGACLGGAPISTGWSLSSANPLPPNVNAVRFAGGQTTVGQLFSVRITLRITQPVPASGLINNSEVFGGDVSILNTGVNGSRSNIWKYVFPSVANASTVLTVLKRIVGMCVPVAPATTCAIQPYTGSSVPSAANLNLRYEVSYLNGSGGAQSNVQLTDTLPLGGAWLAASETVVTGANILPVTTVTAPTATVQGVYNFAPLASLGSGAGGTVQYTAVFATAPPNLKALSNTIKMTSAAVPAGVTSVATTTPTTLASLTINKSTSTPSVTPGGVAAYTITIPNTGGGSANTITVSDTLPSNGLSALPADRFAYLPGVTTTATISTPPVAPATLPTITPVALTAAVTASAAAPFRETVTFSLPAGTILPAGATLTINFSASVGSNMPATATPYLNDASARYLGGATVVTTAMTSSISGVAPVAVTVPMSLSKSVDCVYTGATCVPYVPGSSIPTASKIRYRLDYANTGATAIAGVVLADTLPPNTTFVAGTAAEVAGAGLSTFGTVVPPVLTGQVLTFGTIASLPANARGAVSFDVQLGTAVLIPSGSYLTNNATIKSTLYTAGVAASASTLVQDQANLVVTKTTSTPTIAVNGVATYTIHVVNTGNVAATAIKVYDYLPYVGAAAAPATRFNFNAGSSTYILPAAPSTLTAPPLPVASVGLATNIYPNTKNLNQQQVLWTFGATQSLAPGASFDITFSATAGSAGGLPAGPTVYGNDVLVAYTSGVTALTSGVQQVAPVTIPTNLVVSKTIDCVYSGTACNAYNGTGIVPVNAKVRYKIHYANTAPTAQSNVYICDQITSNQTAPTPLTVTLTTPLLAPSNGGPFVNTPAIGVPASPANALCALPAVVAPTTAVGFSYPVIASLAAGAAGDVYVDMLTNVASGATLSNTAKIVSVQAPSGEVSKVTAVALNVPVLSLTKTTTTPTLTPNGTATYSISVTNTGSAATTALKIADYLPFSGALPDATKRFNYVATTGYSRATTVAPPVPFTPTTPVITSVVAPTVAPYNINPNQQQVTWDFGTAPANQLAPGDTLTITFTATAGAAMPLASYNNSAGFEFTSAAGPGSNNVNGLATVTLAPMLTVSKKIIAVCGGAGCTPTAYTPGTLLPPNALIRYQIDYANPDPLNAHSNVVLSDVLPTQTGVASVGNVVIVSGAITAPSAATLSALPAGGATLSFPTLASLPANATGSITLDVQTTATAGMVVSNTAKLLSTQMGGGVTSTASATVTDLELTKTIVAVCGGAGCTPAAYTPGALIPVNAKVRYQLVYRNASATLAQTNVVLSDVLPTQTAAAAVSNVVVVSGAIAAPAAATLSALGAGGATLTFPTLASLPVGAGGTITLDVQTTAPVASLVTNTAKLSSTQDAIGVSSKVAANTPNLLLSKTLIGVCAGAACTPTAYTPGAVIPPNAKLRYQISYNNASPVAAQTNVVLSDVLPAQTAAAPVSNVVIVSGPISAPNAATLSALAAGGATLSFPALASLAANTGGVITLDVQTNAGAGVTVSNTAKLVSTEDTTGQSSTASADVTNLLISKTTSTAKSLQNGIATYTISITNASAVAVDTIQVYDFLPFSGTALNAGNQFTLVAGSSAYTGGLPGTTVPATMTPPGVAPYSANANQQQVLWDFGVFSLAAGASATITFNAAVGSTVPLGSYTNSAMVMYKVAGVARSTGIDGAATLQIVAKPTINLSKVVKAYSDPVSGMTTPRFLPGGVAEYTVTASNAGGAADTVAIEDLIPANTTLYVRDLGVVGSGPVVFNPGASGLSYQFLGLSSLVDDVEFFNGTVWTVVPVPGADGCDPTITKIRVKPTGVFAGNAATPPSFSVSFHVCLQ